MCKIKINTIFPIIILHCLIFITKVSANNEFCYTSSGVFGIIIASVVITLVVIGLTLATLWFLWTKNRLKLGKKLNYLLYKEHNFEKPVKREVFYALIRSYHIFSSLPPLPSSTYITYIIIPVISLQIYSSV